MTGVSLLYTVLKMDAGPLLTSRTHRLEGNEQAPALLEDLFDEGTDALLETMPSVWDGSIKTVEQDHDQATHAAKLSKEEARLTFTENALIVHNKVRAFSGWPGTWADFELRNGDKLEQIRLKILRTVVLREKGGMCLGVHEVSFDDDKACLDIICDDGSKIGVVEVQPPGKKAMDARSFWNGLQGRSIERKRVPH